MLKTIDVGLMAKHLPTDKGIISHATEQQVK